MTLVQRASRKSNAAKTHRAVTRALWSEHHVKTARVCLSSKKSEQLTGGARLRGFAGQGPMNVTEKTRLDNPSVTICRNIAPIGLSRGKIDNDITSHSRCSIPDDHIDPRRSAFFMARSVLRDIRSGVRAC